MLVVVAAFVANAESQKPRRLTQAPLQLKKCSRSPLHRVAAFSTSATPNAFGVVSPEGVLGNARLRCLLQRL
jgi:hypothetical protein